MTQSESPSFVASSLNASLTVANLGASVAWYRDALGFTVHREYERGGTVRAVAMAAGDVRILLGQDDGAKGVDRVKGEGISLQLTTRQNIDEIAERVRSSGTKLETEPADAFGARVFRVRDPDGFRLTISSER
jgi:uncharacterized glyoxalase superfamily protein PhnB